MGYLFSAPLLFAVALSKSESATGLKAAEWVLLVSGLILLWGAAGEYLEDHKKLYKLPRWLQWTKFVFVLMVVGGLIGEFIGDAGVFVFSEELQSKYLTYTIAVPMARARPSKRTATVSFVWLDIFPLRSTNHPPIGRATASRRPLDWYPLIERDQPVSQPLVPRSVARSLRLNPDSHAWLGVSSHSQRFIGFCGLCFSRNAAELRGSSQSSSWKPPFPPLLSRRN